MGSFEVFREAARTPYIIDGHMGSDSMLKSLLTYVENHVVLKAAKGTTHKQITLGNELEAGSELFDVLCLSCHSVGGLRKDIPVRTRGMPPVDPEAVMRQMGAKKSICSCLWAPKHFSSLKNRLSGTNLCLQVAKVLPGAKQEQDVASKYITEGLQKKAK